MAEEFDPRNTQPQDLQEPMEATNIPEVGSANTENDSTAATQATAHGATYDAESANAVSNANTTNSAGAANTEIITDAASATQTENAEVAGQDQPTQQYAAPEFGQYASSTGSPYSTSQYGTSQYGAPQYGANSYDAQQTQPAQPNQPNQYANQPYSNQPYAGQTYSDQYSGQYSGQSYFGQQYPYEGTTPEDAAANDPKAQTSSPFGAQYGAQTATGAEPDGGANTPTRRQPNTIAVAVTTGIVTVIVSVAMCLGVGMAAINNGWVQIPSSASSSSLSSSTGGSGTAQAVSGQAPDWQQIAKKVSSSVVAIQAEVEQNGQSGIAKGSGAIISKDGDVVTNNHVITGAKQIQVTLSNGQVYEAEVVGTDVTTDLAVIKIKNAPSDLTPVTFADSDNLAVGENIMAIGNPLGYENTATTGIVSALNRPVTVMDEQDNQIVTNAVQIDAAINPGNSGGPTFNAVGQVIGINSSIATASSASSSSEAGSIGIGFAIPSNLVKRVATEIEKDGKVQHVALGVTVTNGSAEVDGATRTGAKITSSQNASSGVVSGSPAAKAGLKANDVIIGYNGKAVNSVSSLLGYVRASSMNETVTLTIVRDGKSMDMKVTLDQAEEAVNGSNRQDNSSRRMQGNSGNSGNSDNSNGNNNQSQNNNGNSNNGNSDKDSGNSFDPFGFGW